MTTAATMRRSSYLQTWRRPPFLLSLLLLSSLVLHHHCSALVPPRKVHWTGNDLVGSWRVTLLDFDRSRRPLPNPSERYKQALSFWEEAKEEVATIRLNEDGTFHLEECEADNTNSLCQGGVWSYRAEPVAEVMLASIDNSLLWRGPLQVTFDTHTTVRLGVLRGEITAGKFRHASPYNPQFFQDPILLHGRSSRRGEFGMQRLAVLDIMEGGQQAPAKEEAEEPPPPKVEEAKEEEEPSSWPELLEVDEADQQQQTSEEEPRSLSEQVNQQQENVAEEIKKLAQSLQNGEIHPLEYLEQLSKLLGGIDYEKPNPAPAPQGPHVPNTEPPFEDADFYNKSFSLAATKFPTAGENLENHHRFVHLDPTLGLGIHALDVACYENNTFSATTELGEVVQGEFGVTGDDGDYVWFQVTGPKVKNKRGYIGQISTSFPNGEPVYSVYGNYYKIKHMQFPEEPEGTFVLQQVRSEKAAAEAMKYAKIFNGDFSEEIFDTPWEGDPDAFQ